VLIVEIVVDHDFPFAGVRPMQSADVLNEATFERKRYSKKKSVQAWQVEALADQRCRREKDLALRLGRSLVDFGASDLSLFYPGATFQTKHGYVSTPQSRANASWSLSRCALRSDKTSGQRPSLTADHTS
jgi:hypothetical protein